MNFVETFEHYSNKLANRSVSMKLWKEIVDGRKAIVDSDEVIEYTFHYPVDTESYLQELLIKFEDSMKEDLRIVSGSLKAYILSFLYYCLGSAGSRIPHSTALLAAELYLKIITIPSGIGGLYFETNLFVMMLTKLLINVKRTNCPVEQIIKNLELVHKYVVEHDVKLWIIEMSSNTFANIIRLRAFQGDIKKCDDPLTKCCLNCIQNFITVKEHPKEIKFIMESLIRYLCCDQSDKESKINQRLTKTAVNITTNFLKDVLLVKVDPNKLQYFLDSIFSVIGDEDFYYVEECVAIINLLNELLYKEFLKRIPGYLESKNHESYYSNLMEVIYHLLKNPHPENFPKLDVLFSVCFKSILIKFVHKNKLIVYKSIEILGKICLLPNNAMVDDIFKLANQTGKFTVLTVTATLKVMINTLMDPYTATPVRRKYILHFASKLLINIDKVDGELASNIIYCVCKDGTPYSVKEVLPNLHELYLQLFNKINCVIRVSIMRIFYKMAMHHDVSASVFLEHLYKCIIYSSTVNGVTHGPHEYSNILFSDSFDYKLFMAKCSNLIKYEHVYHIIANFNHKHTGYPMLLDCLLDYVEYKEYTILTNYIINNYEDMGFYNSTLHFLHAYKRILGNRDTFLQSDLPKFQTIREKVWISLFGQTCGLGNIRSCFVLLDMLKDILGGPAEDQQKDNVMTLASEMAYKALLQQKYYHGSVLHLTEFSIALRREPPQEIMTIFENVMDNRRTLKLLKTRYKDTLIQLVSFYGTIAMMNRPRIPTAAKLFRHALEVQDPFVQIIAVKSYYAICTELTHEFEDIISFCFSQGTTRHTSLGRVCLVILEELIHDNYILLNAQDFMRFTFKLATESLGSFMKNMLAERFLVSNKHDIGRFYMTTLVYMSGYTKFDDYPIEDSFKDNLNVMRMMLDRPNNLIQVLFSSLQVKAKFNILKEMCLTFDSLVAGKRKVDDNFFTYFHYALYTFKVMANKPEFDYKAEFYSQVCRCIDKNIFSKEQACKDPTFYGEFEANVKKCTTSLLELLFYLHNEPRLDEHLLQTFDTVACWIDHVKAELSQYVQYDKCRDFDHSLKRIILIYKILKPRMINFIDTRERPR